MKLRNNKGITLIILSITIVVLIIISTITLSKSSSQLSIRNVNYLYSDIETINTSISDFYLKNGNIPTIGEYCSNKDELAVEFGGTDQINENDGGKYYVIDLSQLDNLTLNYGREFKKWSSASDKYKDIYIINETTHQIYYVKGVKNQGQKYYTSRRS